MEAKISDVVNKLMNELKDYGQVEVEDYGSEKVILVRLAEDLSVYVSILCEDNECSVEYAVGDDNFAIMPRHLNLMDKAVSIMKKVNEELVKMGVVK
jgi:hypothetical protein